MRRTGRTTRMIEAAIAAAENGKAVYVICSHAEHAKTLRDECPYAESKGVKFETWESLGGLNTLYLTLEGAWPNVVVLADHRAIETRYATILEMWQRFDPPSETEMLARAAGLIESLAESLENACEGFEGPEDEDPQATEEVQEARDFTNKIKELLHGKANGNS